MDKKGVSPVIATVLLIVIVLVLATIIFIWAKGFLTESAMKGDRVVESSCEDVVFEAKIAGVQSGECLSLKALDINNIGNVPIYGVKILKYDSATGSIDVTNLGSGGDQTFGSTITVGKSDSVCFDPAPSAGETFRIVPKLLAEKGERKIAYTCPEKDGITITAA